MSAAPRRHYLPAGHIAYFSPFETPARRRERVICVIQKDRGKTFWTKAEGVGYARGIYGYQAHWDWDPYFTSAETWINEPVDNLIAGGPHHFHLRDWARLAWYISTLLARGPDFEWEVAAQAAAMGLDPRAASPGYVIDTQRIGSAVARARWLFICHLNDDLVLGDRGASGAFITAWSTHGYFVPLRRNFGVLLGAGPYPKQVSCTGSEWLIDIPYGTAIDDRSNLWTWHSSRREVYGANEDQLQALRARAEEFPEGLRPISQAYRGAQLLGGTVQDRIRDEVLLLDLVLGRGEPAPDDGLTFTI